MWYRVRRAWKFEESGKSSGIYKSNDGGETWKLVSQPGSGFMTGDKIGRIGIAVYPLDSSDADTLVNNDLDGANISPDRVNLAADFRRGPLKARVQARLYLPRTFNDAATNTDFEGYELFDAYLAYETAIGEFALAAQNLTDKFYITYDSDTVQPNDNSRFFTGRGRTFTLSWRGAF